MTNLDTDQYYHESWSITEYSLHCSACATCKCKSMNSKSELTISPFTLSLNPLSTKEPESRHGDDNQIHINPMIDNITKILLSLPCASLTSVTRRMPVEFDSTWQSHKCLSYSQQVRQVCISDIPAISPNLPVTFMPLLTKDKMPISCHCQHMSSCSVDQFTTSCLVTDTRGCNNLEYCNSLLFPIVSSREFSWY